MLDPVVLAFDTTPDRSMTSDRRLRLARGRPPPDRGRRPPAGHGLGRRSAWTSSSSGTRSSTCCADAAGPAGSVLHKARRAGRQRDRGLGARSREGVRPDVRHGRREGPPPPGRARAAAGGQGRDEAAAGRCLGLVAAQLDRRHLAAGGGDAGALGPLERGRRERLEVLLSEARRLAAPPRGLARARRAARGHEHEPLQLDHPRLLAGDLRDALVRERRSWRSGSGSRTAASS